MRPERALFGALVAAIVVALPACDRSGPVTDAPERTRPGSDPVVPALVGQSGRFGALLAALPDPADNPHWHGERLRRLLGSPDTPDSRGRWSFVSLRLYRFAGKPGPCPIDGVEVAVATRDGRRVTARDLPLPAGAADAKAPELRVLAARTLAARAGTDLPPGNGFEAWLALEPAIEVGEIETATVTFGGETLELKRIDVATEPLAAVIAHPSREALVAVARLGEPAAPEPAPEPLDDGPREPGEKP